MASFISYNKNRLRLLGTALKPVQILQLYHGWVHLKLSPLLTRQSVFLSCRTAKSIMSLQCGEATC